MYQEMDMVVLFFKLYQLHLEVGTDAGEDETQVVKNRFTEHLAAIFCDKDQVNVHFENAMSSMSQFG